jgi:signal peptidase I
MNKLTNGFVKLIRGNIGFIITVIAIILIRIFAFSPLYVDGISMNPTFEDGDFIILNKLDSSYERFDVVVVDEDYAGKGLIKRVIGVGGDTVMCKNNQVFVNGDLLSQDFLSDGAYTNDFAEVIVPDGYYFVLGDNRQNSLDSRDYGVIESAYIDGKVNIILYPFDRFGIID